MLVGCLVLLAGVAVTFAYLAFSIPALIAGMATSHFGLHRTALAYCLAIAALIALAAGSLMLRSRGPAATAEPRAAEIHPPPGPGPGRPQTCKEQV